MPSLSTTAQKLMVQVQEQRKGPFDAIKQMGSLLLRKKQILQHQQQMMKKQCLAAASWSWEMLGTIYLMVETLGGMKDNLKLCLKKVPKSAEKQLDTQEDCISSQKKYILVLDLDETLIHSSTKRFNSEDLEISVKVGDEIEVYYVRQRPYLQQFLEKLTEFFELYVFTAALKEYADKIIDWIDPQGNIKKRFYRDTCTKRDGIFYKDLTKVHPDLTRVFIIDNSTSGFSMNEQNGMLIKSWYHDPKDQELRQYCKFLIDQVNCKKKRWDESNVQTLLDYLKEKYPKNILN